MAHPWIPDGIEGEILKRREHVLRDDEAYVRQLHAEYEAALAADPTVAEGNKHWSRLASWGFLMTAEEERAIWARVEAVEPASEIARRFLDSLPADQAGDLRVDSNHMSVVVQVTRDAERVRSELQERVGPGVTIVVETVRYPTAELERLAETIRQLGIPGANAGVGGDGRVDVGVPKDLDEARRLVSTVAEPCMVKVALVDQLSTLGGGGF